MLLTAQEIKEIKEEIARQESCFQDDLREVRKYCQRMKSRRILIGLYKDWLEEI